MKYRIKNTFNWLITLVLLCVSIATYTKNEEYENIYGKRDMTGIVCEKVNSGETQYRSNDVIINYVLIVKDDITGRYIDFKVNPTIYATHQVGDKINFDNVSKDKLGEDYENSPYQIIYILSAIACGIMLIYSWSFVIDT